MSTAVWFCLGLTALAAVWIAQRHKWRATIRTIFIIVLLTLTICIMIFVGQSVVTTLGPEAPWYARSPGRELVLFGAMLIGMTCRFLTKAIEERRAKLMDKHASGKSVRNLKLAIDRWELIYPLLFSVVTFGALLPQVKNAGITLENVLISFQTGFFWQTVLSAKTGKPPE